jgi:hypothetical protein
VYVGVTSLARPSAMFMFLLFNEEKILILREEYRLGIFRNRMLWRIFGPKRDEIVGGRKDSNRSIFDLLRNQEQIQFGQCLLSVSSQPFLFQSAV